MIDPCPPAARRVIFPRVNVSLNLSAPPPPPQAQAQPSDRLEIAWQNARDALLRLQNPKGYWVGELQGDSILESEYLLLKFILGHETDPDLPKIANYLRGLQNPQGGWSLFPGGPSDLSATAKAYYALKLMGDDPRAAHLAGARQVVLSMGGAEKCNSYSGFSSPPSARSVTTPAPASRRRSCLSPIGFISVFITWRLGREP